MTFRKPETRLKSADAVIVLEADLYRHCDPLTAQALLSKPKTVIVLDHTLTATAQAADLVLPAAAFTEASGTLANNEGRLQRFFRVCAPQGDVSESFRWLRDVMVASQLGPGAARWQKLDDILEDIAKGVSGFSDIRNAAPDAQYRQTGQKIARQSFRASGRTALNANIAVAEGTIPADPDSPLSFSPEGIQHPGEQSLSLRYWSAGINSVQAAMGRQSNERKCFVAGEKSGGQPRPYFRPSAEAFAARNGEWLAMPLHHVFGSEEQSALAPGVASLSNPAAIVLCPADATKLGIRENDTVEVSSDALSCLCIASIADWVKQGSVAVSVGRGDTVGMDLPQWLRVGKRSGS